MRKGCRYQRHAALLGLLLWGSNSWALAPLFPPQPIALDTADAMVRQTFHVQRDWVYSMNLEFQFLSASAIFNDTIVGSRYDASCTRPYAQISIAQRTGLGRPIPLHVTIQRQSDRKVLLDQEVDSLCLTGTSGEGAIKFRTVTKIHLPPGDYVAQITNMRPQTGLEGVKTTISLTAGHSK